MKSASFDQKHRPSRILLLLMGIMLMMLMQVSESVSQTEEYVLKGVFVERFTRFISWPPPNPAIAAVPDTFRIGFYGDHEFYETLRDLYSEKSIRNSPVSIFKAESIDEVCQCKILVVSPDLPINQFKELVSAIKDMSILLISDSAGFGHLGSHINFFIENDKIRFEINEKAFHRSNLTVSYHLLQWAKIVNMVGEG